MNVEDDSASPDEAKPLVFDQMDSSPGQVHLKPTPDRRRTTCATSVGPTEVGRPAQMRP